MLFDEKDLRIFDNKDSRLYFKEILQSYYSQNYRATVVLLYSFVIYDLFIKLQMMANEGDKNAKSKLAEINTMISKDDKYSKVENEVIGFFKDNCPVYFDRFIEDVEYLKNCRNKCAHLKVNDNTLFVPNDYHVRMLICSMYDNILSVKAPFIMDLFLVAQPEIESYSEALTYVPISGPEESIIQTIEAKYLSRMTYDSLLRSYKTFMRLLLISEDKHCLENLTGLYAFAYAMTAYMIKKGYSNVFHEEEVVSIISKIEVESLNTNDLRRNALISLMSDFSIVMDGIRGNSEVFDCLCKRVLLKPQGLYLYRKFHPRVKESIYQFFKENSVLHDPGYTRTLHKALKDSEDFDLAEYAVTMAKAIPDYSGFDAADVYMIFLKEHLDDIPIKVLEEIMDVYDKNGQCTKRIRHEEDYKVVMEYIESNGKAVEAVSNAEKNMLDDEEIPF